MPSSVPHRRALARALAGVVAVLVLASAPQSARGERGRHLSGNGTAAVPKDPPRGGARGSRDGAPPLGSLRVAQLSAGAPTASGDAVALFEYRNDVKQLADLVDRLTAALQQNTSLSVINLVEARRRLGPQVDADVARCDGETRCLTGVGEKLHAKEVLLLAVSQLGDVVLALQRIDVAEKRVVARYADSLSNGQGVDETRLLGWLQQLYPPEAFKRYGQIRIATDAEGAGAQVYVNAKPKGQTPLSEPLSVLAPGNYRLLIEKPRFLPFQAAVTVMPDTVVEVEARLQREAVQTPWYKRWYVWAGIGAGIAAVAATGVAIYYATDKPPPDMTRIPGTVVLPVSPASPYPFGYRDAQRLGQKQTLLPPASLSKMFPNPFCRQEAQRLGQKQTLFSRRATDRKRSLRPWGPQRSWGGPLPCSTPQQVHPQLHLFCQDLLRTGQGKGLADCGADRRQRMATMT